MVIAKIFQPTTGQPPLQQISMPVSPKRQLLGGVLTSDRPFIQPAGLVSQTSSHPVTGPGELPVAQPTGLVNLLSANPLPVSVRNLLHQLLLMFFNTL